MSVNRIEGSCPQHRGPNLDSRKEMLIHLTSQGLCSEFSVGTNFKDKKRGLGNENPQHQAKRQKTISTTDDVKNKHLFSNVTSNSPPTGLNWDTIRVENGQFAKKIVEKKPLNGIIQQRIKQEETTTTTESVTSEECKGDKIKSDYMIFSSSVRYYQDVLEAAHRREIDKIFQLDRSEVQSVLGDIHGYAWWIRKDALNGQEHYVGITYLNGVWSHCLLSTNDDFVKFCAEKNQDLHLEALRRKKADEIKDVKNKHLFSNVTSNSPPTGLNWDTIHVENGQFAKKIVEEKPLNGIIQQRVKQEETTTTTESVTSEECKGDKIKSDYMIFSSSVRYYQDVLEAAHRREIDKIFQLDRSEVLSVLGDIHGYAWWIRKDALNGQEHYVGITYLNGIWNHCSLSTNNALVKFCVEKNQDLHLEALRREKINKIRSNYMVFPSSVRYYEDVLQAASRRAYNEVLSMDASEVQSVLGDVNGNAWWIRKDAINGQECCIGITYSNGTWSRYALSTDDNLINFCNGKDPALHLEALRREEINKIRSNYMVFPSSVRYYQDVLQAASRRAYDEVSLMDASEVQSVLGGINGDAWWIRKDAFNGQEYCIGTTYSNNVWQYFTLFTDSDVIRFCNKKDPALHLEALRREKINKIRSDYMVFPSSIRYYEDVLQTASRRAYDEVLWMDASEVQSVLGGVNGNAWWIRKNVINGQECCIGIVYSNNIWQYFTLFTDSDVIRFCNRKIPELHLEFLRREKINKIKNDCERFFSSVRYYEDVLQAAFRGENEKVLCMDAAEIQPILGGTDGEVWWVRKNAVNGQERFVGVIYSNGQWKYTNLPTDNDFIKFYNGKNPNLHLEVLRKEKKIEEYIMIHPSSVYYQSVFTAESQGAVKEALRLDLLEAQTVLGDVIGTVWWIRESVLNGQKIYKGIYYSGADDFSRSIFYTKDEAVEFCKKNDPLLHLEKVRKEHHFGPLKNLPKQLYDVIDAKYTLEDNIDERYNVLQKMVRIWLPLVDLDKARGRKTNNDIKESFQRKINLSIDNKTLKSIKEGDVVKILNEFMDKNK